VGGYDSSATMISCTFDGNTRQSGSSAVGGAIVVNGNPGSATMISCSFKGSTGSHVDSVYNYVGGSHYSTTTFACPSTRTGTPVKITELNELEAEQLPPATEIVHCTLKLPQ
jgi:hypothetical protein